LRAITYRQPMDTCDKFGRMLGGRGLEKMQDSREAPGRKPAS